MPKIRTIPKKITIYCLAIVILAGGLLVGACQKSSEKISSSAGETSSVKAINGDKDFKKVMQSSHTKLVVIDFYADWCGPCRQLSPILEKIARELDQEVQFYKVNIDEHRILSMKSGVSGIPYVTIFKKGKKVHSLMGLWPSETYIRDIKRFAFPTESAPLSDMPDGKLVDGVRVIHRTPGNKLDDIFVYRGETVKLVFENLMAAYAVAIPEYEISEEGAEGNNLEVSFKAKKIGVFPIFCNGDCPNGDGMEYGRIVVMPFTGSKKAIYKELDVKETKRLIVDQKALVLDVRTPNEFYSGHLPEAKLIPVQQLSQRLSEIAEYKQKKILVYCRSGNRSTVASEILIHNGFQEVYHLKNGIIAWSKEGYALDK